MNEIGKQTMKQVRKRNLRAFQKLVAHYQQSVYTICVLMVGNKEKAEELASETFLYAYSHTDNYFKADKKVSVWLFQSTVCLAKKRFKEDNCVYGENGLSTEDILFLLLSVPLKNRVAIILNCCYHLSDQEISDVLNVSKSEIRTYIFQAREKLSEALQCMNTA